MKNIKAFTMPKWGIEMQEGTISEWAVSYTHLTLPTSYAV